MTAVNFEAALACKCGAVRRPRNCGHALGPRAERAGSYPAEGGDYQGAALGVVVHYLQPEPGWAVRPHKTPFVYVCTYIYISIYLYMNVTSPGSPHIWTFWGRVLMRRAWAWRLVWMRLWVTGT